MSKHLDFFQEYIPLLRNNHNLDTLVPRFRKYVIENIDEICEELDTRWLVSICDTFVDHGDEKESLIAFNISFLVNYERLMQTHYTKNTREDMMEVRELWDGCNSYHLIRGDTLRHILARISKVSYQNKKYIYLGKIFSVVWNRMVENDTTIGNLMKM